MSDPRKFKGVWIPADLWVDRSLSITEKVMLLEIDSLETEERGCYAGNAYFAEFFSLSISRVSEIISGLAQRGFIRIEQIRDGKMIVERRIWMTPPFGKPNTPSENAANPFGKGGEPPSEKAKENNTEVNNTGNNTTAPTREPAKEYAFAGRVVRLNQRDFDSWSTAFSHLELRAELLARDAWLAEQPEKDRKAWFQSTSKYLANRNGEAKANKDSPNLFRRMAGGRGGDMAI